MKAKRILCLCLIFCLVLSLMSIGVFADTEFVGRSSDYGNYVEYFDNVRSNPNDTDGGSKLIYTGGVSESAKAKRFYSDNKENRCFVFNSLDNIFAASEALKDFACGDSALYKDTSTGDYYLLVHSKGLDAGEYKNLCMILSDFCSRSFKTGAYEAYVKEHFKAVKESMALQALARV